LEPLSRGWFLIKERRMDYDGPSFWQRSSLESNPKENPERFSKSSLSFQPPSAFQARRAEYERLPKEGSCRYPERLSG